jgi:hypothetical protein
MIYVFKSAYGGISFDTQWCLLRELGDLHLWSKFCMCNVFPNVLCVHKPFPTIYTFLQFTPF